MQWSPPISPRPLARLPSSCPPCLRSVAVVVVVVAEGLVGAYVDEDGVLSVCELWNGTQWFSAHGDIPGRGRTRHTGPVAPDGGVYDGGSVASNNVARTPLK